MPSFFQSFKDAVNETFDEVVVKAKDISSEAFNVITSPTRIGIAGTFDFGAGLVEGATGLIGGAGEYASRDLFGQEAAPTQAFRTIRETGETVAQDFTQAGQTLRTGAKTITGQPAEQDQLSSDILRTAGQIGGSYLVPGGAALKTVSYLTRVVKNPVVRYGLASTSSSIGLAATEAAAEANQVYNDLVSSTGDQETADIRASIAFQENFKLLGISNLASLPLLHGGGRVLNAVKRGLAIRNGNIPVKSTKAQEFLKKAAETTAGLTVESFSEVLQSQITDRAMQGLQTSFKDFGNKLANLTPEDKELALKVFLGGLIFRGVTGTVDIDFSDRTANGKATKKFIEKLESHAVQSIKIEAENEAEMGAAIFDGFTAATIEKNPDVPLYAITNMLETELSENGVSSLYDKLGQAYSFFEKDVREKVDEAWVDDVTYDIGEEMNRRRVYAKLRKQRRFDTRMRNKITLQLPSFAEVKSFLYKTAENVASAESSFLPAGAAGAALATVGDTLGLEVSAAALPFVGQTQQPSEGNIRTLPQITEFEQGTILGQFSEDARDALYRSPTGMLALLREGDLTSIPMLKTFADTYIKNLSNVEQRRIKRDLEKRGTTLQQLVANKDFDTSFVGRHAEQLYAGLQQVQQYNPEILETMEAYTDRLVQQSLPTGQEAQEAEQLAEQLGLVYEGSQRQKDVEKLVGTLPTRSRLAVRGRFRELKETAKTPASFTWRGVKKVFTYLNNEMRAIAPNMWGDIEKMELNIIQNDKRLIENEDGTALIQQYQKRSNDLKLSEAQHALIGNYWNTGQRDKMKEMIDRGDTEILEDIFDEIKNIEERAENVGIFIPTVENFLPRAITRENYERFLKEFKLKLPKYQTELQKVEESFGRKLTEKEQLNLAKLSFRNDHLQVFVSELTKGRRTVDRIVKRTIETPSPDMVHYYSDPADALRSYFFRMNRILAVAEFLAKNNSLVMVGESGDKRAKLEKQAEAKNVFQKTREEQEEIIMSELNKADIGEDGAPLADEQKRRLWETVNNADLLATIYTQSGIGGFDTVSTIPLGVDFAKSAGRLINEIRKDGTELTDQQIDDFNAWFDHYLQRKTTKKLPSFLANTTYGTTLLGLLDMMTAFLETGQVVVEYGPKNTIKGIASTITRADYAKIKDFVHTNQTREARSGEDYYLRKTEKTVNALLRGFTAATNIQDQITSNATYNSVRDSLLSGKLTTHRKRDLEGLFKPEEIEQLKKEMKAYKNTDKTKALISAMTNGLVGHNFFARSYIYHKYNNLLRLIYTLRTHWLSSILGRIGQRAKILKDKNATKKEKANALIGIFGIVAVYLAEDQWRDIIVKLLRGEEIKLDAERVIEAGIGLTPFGNRYIIEGFEYELVGGVVKTFGIPFSIAEIWGEALISLGVGSPDRLIDRTLRSFPYLGDTAGEILVQKLREQRKKEESGASEGFQRAGFDRGGFTREGFEREGFKR